MSLKIKSGGINYNVPTVNDFPTEYLEEGLVCVVTDENQGGTFVYRADNALVNNGGTIFDGWTRQYDGAVNVKWFGAVGDGVADDTVAIQSTIDYAFKVVNYSEFNETNEVYRDAKIFTTAVEIPNGLYIVSDTIRVHNGTIIKGESILSTRVVVGSNFFGSKTRTLYNPEGNDTVNFIFDSRRENGSEWTWGIEVSNISIVNTNNVPNIGGVNLTHTHKYLIDNCSFSNMKYGVYLYGAWSGQLNRITTHYCNSAGIYLDFIDGNVDTEIGSSQECNAVLITDCYVEYGNNYGYRLDRCNGVEIIGGAVQRCGKDGLYSDGINKGVLIKTYFEGNCRILEPGDNLFNPLATVEQYYDINLGLQTEYLITINSIFFSKYHRCIGINYGKHINIKAFNFLNTAHAKAIVHVKQGDVSSIVIDQLGYDPNTTPTEAIIQNTSGNKDVFSSPLKASWFTYGNEVLRIDHINYAYAACVLLDKNLLCNNGVLTVPTVFEGNGNYLTAQVVDTPALTVQGANTVFNNVYFASNANNSTGSIVVVDTASVTFNKCNFGGVSAIGAVTILSGAVDCILNSCTFTLSSGNRAIKTSASRTKVEHCKSSNSATVYIESIGNYFTGNSDNITFSDQTSSKMNFLNNRIYRTTAPIHTPVARYDAVVYNSNPSGGGHIGWVYASGAWKTFGAITA